MNRIASLHRLMRAQKAKIYFCVEGVADLYTAGGLVAALGIPKEQVILKLKKTGREIDPKKAREMLPGFFFTAQPKPPKNAVIVKFDTQGPVRFEADGSVTVTYDPLKYFLSPRGVKKNKNRIRLAMKLGRPRKIIVISCTTADEVRFVIKACKKIRRVSKPLLIVALRKRNLSLGKIISSRERLKVSDRRSSREPVAGFGKSDVVLLNTMGELLDFMPAADLAIVGHDRNLFEPAFFGVPALYFKQPLKMNRRDAQLAKRFNLFWRKNRTAKRLLDRYRGGVSIQMKSFHRQIDHILQQPAAMIRGTQQAVRAMHRQVLPKVRPLIAAKLIESLGQKK